MKFSSYFCFTVLCANQFTQLCSHLTSSISHDGFLL